mgnify:CR=1 FL=1
MKFIPHEYQKYAIDRVVADPALGLFLEMGLGKDCDHLDRLSTSCASTAGGVPVSGGGPKK